MVPDVFGAGIYAEVFLVQAFGAGMTEKTRHAPQPMDQFRYLIAAGLRSELQLEHWRSLRSNLQQPHVPRGRNWSPAALRL